MMSVDGQQETGPRHILQELGFIVGRDGDELRGSGPVTSEIAVPGTARLRTSVLAVWCDVVAGLLAANAVAPRVPVTLELDVQLYRPAPVEGTVVALGRTVRQGRSVFVAAVEFTCDDGEPLATAGATFMLAPDATLRLPANLSIDEPFRPATLSVPLAERARIERTQPGVAMLPRSDDGLNSSRTVNGGLIAVVAEEAALSLTPGQTLCSLSLRYLHPIREGPAVATAEVRRGLGRVELRDAGSSDRLSVLATTRIFP